MIEGESELNHVLSETAFLWNILLDAINRYQRVCPVNLPAKSVYDHRVGTLKWPGELCVSAA